MAFFAAHGFALWNGNWYGGHYTLSYSVLAPPLTWLLGSVPLAIASAVASTALFQMIVRRHFGPAALAGAVWFALAAGTLVYHGRVTFGAGVVAGLLAVGGLAGPRGLALQRSSTAALASVPPTFFCGMQQH